MTEEQIIQTLKSKGNPFKKLSIKELNYIESFMRKKLQSKNGTWTQKNLKKLMEDYNFNNHSGVFVLRLFSTEYERRKRKKLRALDKLLTTIDKQYKKSQEQWWERYNRGPLFLELKDKAKIGDFLQDISALKSKHIRGNNDALIEMIADHIKTGYKKNTLRSYYYHHTKK